MTQNNNHTRKNQYLWVLIKENALMMQKARKNWLMKSGPVFTPVLHLFVIFLMNYSAKSWEGDGRDNTPDNPGIRPDWDYSSLTQCSPMRQTPHPLPYPSPQGARCHTLYLTPHSQAPHPYLKPTGPPTSQTPHNSTPKSHHPKSQTPHLLRHHTTQTS